MAAGLVQKCAFLPAVGCGEGRITFPPQTHCSRVLLKTYRDHLLVHSFGVWLQHSHQPKRTAPRDKKNSSAMSQVWKPFKTSPAPALCVSLHCQIRSERMHASKSGYELILYFEGCIWNLKVSGQPGNLPTRAAVAFQFLYNNRIYLNYLYTYFLTTVIIACGPSHVIFADQTSNHIRPCQLSLPRP